MTIYNYKNYFVRPSVNIIKQFPDKNPKEAIEVTSIDECIEALEELSSQKYELDNKFLNIKFNPIPEKFMSYKKPSLAYLKKGKVIDFNLPNSKIITLSTYEQLFNTTQKISQKKINESFAFALSYSKDINSEFVSTSKLEYIVIRLNDLVRSAKLRSLNKNSPSSFDVKIYHSKKEAYANAVIRISSFERGGPLHQFKIENIPLKKILGYRDFAGINFKVYSGNEEISNSEYVNRREINNINLNPNKQRKILIAQEIAALEVIKEALNKKDHRYFSDITPIFPVPQKLVDMCDILQNHTIINRYSGFDEANQIPTLVDIDSILLNYFAKCAKEKNSLIITPSDYNNKGLFIKPEDLDFELFDPKTNKFYSCSMYSDINKHRKLSQGIKA